MILLSSCELEDFFALDARTNILRDLIAGNGVHDTLLKNSDSYIY